MHVKRIVLSNIRGFESLDFDLERSPNDFAGWTVFTGNNGSGKSAVLKAIVIGLTGIETARSLQPGFRGWIHEGKKAEAEASIEVSVVRVPEDDALVRPGAPPNEFPAKILFRNNGRETTLEATKPASVNQRNYSTPSRTIWSSDAKGWFSCGYGPFRRVFGASLEATRQMAAPSTERFVTMFQEAASLAEVDQWLRNLKHKELEDKNLAHQQLRRVLDILCDDLMPNGITVDQVARQSLHRAQDYDGDSRPLHVLPRLRRNENRPFSAQGALSGAHVRMAEHDVELRPL